MDFKKKEWASQDRIPKSLLDRSNYSSSSRLAEFKSKLGTNMKSPKFSPVPSWKSFRNEIRHKISPPRVSSPKFDQYSSIENFRTLNSPRNASPFWRYRASSESRIRSFSRPQSPKSNLTPNMTQKRLIDEIIKNSDLKSGLASLNEMTEQDIRGLPLNYIGDLNRFCTQVLYRLRTSGFEFS